MAKRRDPNSRHYVDNQEFLKAITAYRERVIAAKEAGDLSSVLVWGNPFSMSIGMSHEIATARFVYYSRMPWPRNHPLGESAQTVTLFNRRSVTLTD